MLIKALESLKSKYGVTIDELWRGVLYLKKYGYLDDLDADQKTFRKAVKLFQTFFQLKEDGLLGPKSLRAMEAPRCCVPDTLAATNRKWNRREIRYYIDGYVSGLSRSVTANIIKAAWKSWANHVDLVFIRTNNRSLANIMIGVGRGTRYNFDGSGGTLAWAQLPSGNDRQLRTRFDLDETWISNPTKRGILLLNVAAHEFGHLLGLGHSSVSGALMAPFYNPRIDEPQQKDDVSRIHSIYEAVEPPKPKPTPTPKPGRQTVTIVVEGKVIDVKVKK